MVCVVCMGCLYRKVKGKNGMLKPSVVGRFENLQIDRDLSGQVRLVLGEHKLLLPPKQATDIAVAILRCAGVDVRVDNPGRTIVGAVN